MEQAQTMLCNVVAALRQVPRQCLKDLLRSIGVETTKRWGTSWAMVVASALVKVSPAQVRNTLRRASKSSMRLLAYPCEDADEPMAFADASEDACPHIAPVAAADTTASQDSAATRELCNLVRLAIANAVQGRSGRAFERDCARMSLAGGSVGDNLHSRHFAREAEQLAAWILRELDAQDFCADLPGIGIMSDFSLLLDPVSIGRTAFPRHDTLLMLCIAIVSPHNGRLYTPMLDGPAMPLGGRTGEQMRYLALQSLRGHVFSDL